MFKQELQVFPTRIRVCLCNQQQEEENARETTIAIRECANELANHTQRAHTINEPRTRRQKNYIFSLFVFPVRVCVRVWFATSSRQLIAYAHVPVLVHTRLPKLCAHPKIHSPHTHWRRAVVARSPLPPHASRSKTTVLLRFLAFAVVCGMHHIINSSHPSPSPFFEIYAHPTRVWVAVSFIEAVLLH